MKPSLLYLLPTYVRSTQWFNGSRQKLVLTSFSFKCFFAVSTNSKMRSNIERVQPSNMTAFFHSVNYFLPSQINPLIHSNSYPISKVQNHVKYEHFYFQSVLSQRLRIQWPKTEKQKEGRRKGINSALIDSSYFTKHKEDIFIERKEERKKSPWHWPEIILFFFDV